MSRNWNIRTSWCSICYRLLYVVCIMFMLGFRDLRAHELLGLACLDWYNIEESEAIVHSLFWIEADPFYRCGWLHFVSLTLLDKGITRLLCMNLYPLNHFALHSYFLTLLTLIVEANFLLATIQKALYIECLFSFFITSIKGIIYPMINSESSYCRTVWKLKSWGLVSYMVCDGRWWLL